MERQKKTDRLNKAVTKIIRSVKTGRYFDSHMVISQLLQKHHDAYLTETGKFPTTRTYHSHISKIIQSNVDLVEDTRMKSLSKNVLDKFSYCQLWKRIGK